MRQQPIPTYTADDALDLTRDWSAEACAAGPEGFRAWLEKERPHLLRAYDFDFLRQAAESMRSQPQQPR